MSRNVFPTDWPDEALGRQCCVVTSYHRDGVKMLTVRFKETGKEATLPEYEVERDKFTYCTWSPPRI